MAFPNPLSLSILSGNPSTTLPTPGSVSHQLLHLEAKSSVPSVIGSRCSLHPELSVLVETLLLPPVCDCIFPCSVSFPFYRSLLSLLSVLERIELDLRVLHCCCSLPCSSIVLFHSPLHKDFPFSFCSSCRLMLLA